MLLPATFVLPPVSALIMLAGIYYGAQYGGSTTAILVNLPGEVSSVVTCLDGYQMARQGHAGKALGIAALGSFFAGSVATVLIAGFAPPLAELARLDDAAFRALFAKSPVKRTGRERFVRNVLIAIGNSGDAALAAQAERLIGDASPLVRGAHPDMVKSCQAGARLPWLFWLSCEMILRPQRGGTL